jgi:hypothetical protein
LDPFLRLGLLMSSLFTLFYHILLLINI